MSKREPEECGEASVRHFTPLSSLVQLRHFGGGAQKTGSTTQARCIGSTRSGSLGLVRCPARIYSDPTRSRSRAGPGVRPNEMNYRVQQMEGDQDDGRNKRANVIDGYGGQQCNPEIQKQSLRSTYVQPLPRRHVRVPSSPHEPHLLPTSTKRQIWVIVCRIERDKALSVVAHLETGCLYELPFLRRKHRDLSPSAQQPVQFPWKPHP